VVLATIAFAIVILIALSVAAQPEDSPDTEPADSLGTEPADSLGTEPADSLGVERSGRRGRRGGGAGVEDEFPATTGSWFWDTHPDFSINISKKKDVTNWDTKITLRKQVSSKLNFNLSASLRTRENSTLNRSDSNDGTSAGLKYRLNDNIGFGLRYNSNISAYRYDLDRKEPDDRKGKEDVSVSAEFSKALLPGFDIRLTTNAGTTQNAYGSVRNKGSREDIAASISYSPNSSLRSSVSYNANRLLLDSKVDSSGSAVFSSQDRTFSQDLSLTVAYDIMPGVKINVDAGRTDRQKQHPDPILKEQETERRSSRNASVGTAFDLMTWLKWDVSVSFNESDSRFDLHSDRDNSTRRSGLKGSARLMPWRGAIVNLGGGRETSRNMYATTDTGRDLHKSLTLKLTQDLGRKANLNLTALSDMTSVFYADKVQNDKDRDRLNNRVALDVDYKPLDAISTRLAAEYSDERTVYIMAANSGSNRTTRKFRVSGGYDVKTFGKVGLKQDYDISAIYTFYEYGKDRNTLVRNSNIRTRFNIPLRRALSLNVNHQYKFQDQGGYSEKGGQRLYARSAERETNILSIALRYTFLRYIKITVRNSYQIQRSWAYIQGKKELQYETPTTDLSGSIGFSYKFGDRTKVSLSFQQNRKEGSRVSEAFRKYRNIEFEASHVF
jgi:hypothetical protein